MSKVKSKLDQVMENIREENPDATWGNLLTGIGILLLVAVFSISYFGRSPEDTDVLGESNRGNSEQTQLMGSNGENGDDLGIFSTSVGERVIVEKGEGLWHVAKRVCNDGEKYNYLAEANGLTIWSRIAEGQELVVECGPSDSPQN